MSTLRRPESSSTSRVLRPSRARQAPSSTETVLDVYKRQVLADEFAAIQKEYDEKRKFRKNDKKREEAAGKEKAAA